MTHQLVIYLGDIAHIQSYHGYYCKNKVGRIQSLVVDYKT